MVSNGMKKLLFVLGILFLLAALVFGGLKFYDVFFTEEPEDMSAANQNAKEKQEEQQPVQENQPVFGKSKHSLDDPASIWVVVNKTRPLNPKNYVPADRVFPSVTLRVPGNESMQIRADISHAVKALFGGAKAAGHSLKFSSGYRSYSYQVNLYSGYVKSIGQAEADKQSARPGHSEHQTGLSLDVCDNAGCDLVQSFGQTAMGQWVAAHAHEYGFIIRYPEGKTAITGYEYEPWHLRYVGTELAGEMRGANIQTLEEFFGLPAAPDYL